MSEVERMAALLPAYEMGPVLGRGAFGTVYGARHRRLGRDVAVKLLPEAIAADPESRRRFETEARVIASFDHPHIVQVFDFLDDAEICLLVMERVDGGTLGARFGTRARPEDACGIALAMADALHYAHERGVLHRDVKPDNVLFGGSGTLRVTDFGIAKVLGMSATVATQAGMVLGTPAYMSPEQAMGFELTAASDVYSVALVLYELLSGLTPYRDDSNPLVVLHAHAYEDARPLWEVAPHIPGPIASVVMRGLARGTAERIPTAAAFEVALARAATDAFGPHWLSRSSVQARLSPPVTEIVSGAHMALPTPTPPTPAPPVPQPLPQPVPQPQPQHQPQPQPQPLPRPAPAPAPTPTPIPRPAGEGTRRPWPAAVVGAVVAFVALGVARAGDAFGLRASVPVWILVARSTSFRRDHGGDLVLLAAAVSAVALGAAGLVGRSRRALRTVAGIVGGGAAGAIGVSVYNGIGPHIPVDGPQLPFGAHLPLVAGVAVFVVGIGEGALYGLACWAALRADGVRPALLAAAAGAVCWAVAGLADAVVLVTVPFNSWPFGATMLLRHAAPLLAVAALGPAGGAAHPAPATSYTPYPPGSP